MAVRAWVLALASLFRLVFLMCAFTLYLFSLSDQERENSLYRRRSPLSTIGDGFTGEVFGARFGACGAFFAIRNTTTFGLSIFVARTN